MRRLGRCHAGQRSFPGLAEPVHSAALGLLALGPLCGGALGSLFEKVFVMAITRSPQHRIMFAHTAEPGPQQHPLPRTGRRRRHILQATVGVLHDQQPLLRHRRSHRQMCDRAHNMLTATTHTDSPACDAPCIRKTPGSPGEFHPEAPTEPCVTISRYTALLI